MANRRRRGVNPRYKHLISRVANEYPGMNPSDLSMMSGWLVSQDLKDGVLDLSRGVSVAVIVKAIDEDPTLLQLVAEGKIALAPLATTRSKDPEFVNRIDDRTSIVRSGSGKAVALIRAEAVRRANAMTDPVARKVRISMIDHDLALFSATPTQRVLALSKTVDDAEDTTTAYEDERAERAKVQKQFDLLMESNAATQRLLLRYLGEERMMKEAAD